MVLKLTFVSEFSAPFELDAMLMAKEEKIRHTLFNLRLNFGSSSNLEYGLDL